MLANRGGVGREDEDKSIDKTSDHKRDNDRATSKVVGDSAVKSAPLTELRRPDSDAAAVTQFVDSVENIDDIETDFDSSLCRDLDPARKADVECLVWMVLLGVGKTSAQPVSIKSVDG